jgi:hypothetical protein
MAWQLQDAKARLSEVLKLAQRNGPQATVRRVVSELARPRPDRIVTDWFAAIADRGRDSLLDRGERRRRSIA